MTMLVLLVTIGSVLQLAYGNYYDFQVCKFSDMDWNVDFTSLSSKSNYRSAKLGSKHEVYINLCHPLPPTLNCMGLEIGSVCYCKEDVNGTRDCNMIATHYDDGFTTSDKGNLLMLLDNSGLKDSTKYVCKNQTLQLLTKIEFICSKSVKSNKDPQFVSVVNNSTNCEFNLKWETDIVCRNMDPPVKVNEISTHIFLDPRVKKSVNLTQLFTNTIPITEMDYHTGQNYTYVVSLNDAIPESYFKIKNVTIKNECANAAICQINYEKLFSRTIAIKSKYQMLLKNNALKLQFPTEQKCEYSKNHTVTTLINFGCNNNSDGPPHLKFEYESSQCQYIFEYIDKYLCALNLVDVNATTIAKNDKNATEVIPTRKSDTTDKADSVTTNATTAIHEPNNGSSSSQIVSNNNGTIASDARKLEAVINDKSVNNSDDSNDNIKERPAQSLFGLFLLIVIAVTSVLLAIILIINDNRRAWLLNKIRRLFGPQVSTSFHYSQVLAMNGVERQYMHARIN